MNLLGPFIISERTNSAESHLTANTNSLDIIDLLDLQGAYGSAESLNYLGYSYLQGSGRIKRDFAKSKELFMKSLALHPDDVYANYYLGFMAMLGLGEPVDIPTAVLYFEKSAKSPEALNALGVIYQSAPDTFEKDATIIRPYGKIRKDTKKSKKFFDQASELGNFNSRYNLG